MGENITLRYVASAYREGPAAFLKKVVLTYPKIEPSQQLDIVLPRDAENLQELVKIAEFFALACPNVSLHIDDGAAPLKNGSELVSDPFNLLHATECYLRSEGIHSPFDSGLVLPNVVAIDLEDDLGLTDETLQNLGEELFSWNFNSQAHTVDELLGFMFLLFKKLLSEPGIPSEVRISDQQLLWFLAVGRALYHPHVPYHSYRHCVDVTQLTFALIHVDPPAWALNPGAKLAMVLAALGHDMKHPGLVVQVIRSIDKKFELRWESLEAYHLDVFKTLLEQLWPSVKHGWSNIVRDAINATEMAKHQHYLKPSPNETLSFVHALKISDFASAIRHDHHLYDINASLIFIEFYNQALICHRLREKYDFPRQKVDVAKPIVDSFVSMQLTFLGQIVLPYFEWIAQRIPWFTPHLRTAQNHLRHFERMENSQDVSELSKRLILVLD